MTRRMIPFAPFRPIALSLLALGVIATTTVAQDVAHEGKASQPSEGQLAEVQGRWERVEPEGSEASYKRATKEIKGNQETVTYFDADGKVVRQHKVDFKLSRMGDVNVFTYTNWEATEGPQKGTKMPGPVSYVYRVSEKQFREAWGFLPGQENRSSLLLVWKRADEDRKEAGLAAATEKAPAPDPAPAPAPEKAAGTLSVASIQGEWTPASSERGGRPQDQEEMKRHALKFDGDKFTITRDGDAFISGIYKLDAAKSPAEIDMTIEQNSDNPEDNGKVVRGILELAGDELKWCTGGPRTDERPAAFKTEEGARTMLIVFKRAAKAQAQAQGAKPQEQ